MFDPHHAFDPPIAALERYRDMLDDIPLPNYVEGELENKPIWQQIDHIGSYGKIGGYPYRAIKLEMQGRLIDRMAWTVDPLPDRQALW